MYNQKAVKYYEKGKLLRQKGKLIEAEKAYRKAIKINTDFVEAYNNLGNVLLDRGLLQEASNVFRKALNLLPDHPLLQNNLANSLQLQGKNEAAITLLNKVISKEPEFADAHNNLGNALKELGQSVQATASYELAIKINPGLAEPHNNLGNIFKELEKTEQAIESFNQAIRINPDFADAYYNLGNVLKNIGQHEDAAKSFRKSLELEPDNALFLNGYSGVLSGIPFTSYNEHEVERLEKILDLPTIRPLDIAEAALAVLRHQPTIKQALESIPCANDSENLKQLVQKLSRIPLLLRIMGLSLIADVDFEKMLTGLRRALLEQIALEKDFDQGLAFLSALASNCFINEYLFAESARERQQLEALQHSVEQALANGSAVPSATVAILAAYIPLYSFSWANELKQRKWPKPLNPVIGLQLDNHNDELAIRSTIPELKPIEDSVSQLVRDQYEENPYPRWVKTGLIDNPKSISQILSDLHIEIDSQQYDFPDNPDVLIGGCGTGQHALNTATRYSHCNVLAVDLSLSSLAYAVRKTRESGIDNIDFLHGDILDFDLLEREFDIVESVGVIHHMEEPLVGWKSLIRRLRRGGLMKLGLYSEIARKSVVEARQQISDNKLSSTAEGIRRYRQELLDNPPNPDSELGKLLHSRDFYSLSTCRDLLFHVQEHRFTLPQIEKALDELGLEFLGFDFSTNWTRQQFRKLHPEKEALLSLELWHQFERENPDIFSGMYVFWMQKK